jgi:hypothetical protein
MMLRFRKFSTQRGLTPRLRILLSSLSIFAIKKPGPSEGSRSGVFLRNDGAYTPTTQTEDPRISREIITTRRRLKLKNADTLFINGTLLSESKKIR